VANNHGIGPVLKASGDFRRESRFDRTKLLHDSDVVKSGREGTVSVRGLDAWRTLKSRWPNTPAGRR